MIEKATAQHATERPSRSSLAVGSRLCPLPGGACGHVELHCISNKSKTGPPGCQEVVRWGRWSTTRRTRESLSSR